MSGYFRAYSEKVRQASRELPERELRVYLVMLSYADCRGKCWPGIKTLVTETGLYTDAIYSALEALLTQKYIAIVRKGIRDKETGYSLPNIYKVYGAFLDDEDCPDIEAIIDDPILGPSSTEVRNTTRTDSESTKPELTRPETPPPTLPISSKVEVPKTKTTAKTGKEKTPERSSIPKPPNPVPQPPSPRTRVYTGSLSHRSEPLPDEQEQIVNELRAIDQRLSVRHAREMVATNPERAKLAIAHFYKQKNIYNPAGFLRTLIERDVVEAADAEPINEGLKYITGPYGDYINH